MNDEEFGEDYFEPNFPLKNATNFSQKRDKHGVLIKRSYLTDPRSSFVRENMSLRFN